MTFVHDAMTLSWGGLREIKGNISQANSRVRRCFLATSSRIHHALNRIVPTFQPLSIGTMRLANSILRFDIPGALQSSLDIGRPLFQLLDDTIPNSIAHRYIETLNKLTVFDLVRNADQHLPFDILSNDLPRLVRAASQKGIYDELWLLEGAAYHYTKKRLAASVLDGLLDPAQIARLPKEPLLMLHAGMGMAIAESVVVSLEDTPAQDRIAASALWFARLCETNCRDGYRGAAIETLGLVVRMFRPRLLEAFDSVLRASHDSYRSYFWHGVGRCSYLISVNKPTLAGVTSRDSWIDAGARCNFIAGVSWAATLANMRHPAVFVNVHNRYRMSTGNPECFDAGILSSVSMHLATTGRTSLADSFCNSMERYSTRADTAHLYQLLPRASELNRVMLGRNTLDHLFHTNDSQQ